MGQSSDIHVHGVSLHRRGEKPEHGTLSLTPYHLTFTYTPGVPPDDGTATPTTSEERHRGDKRSQAMSVASELVKSAPSPSQTTTDHAEGGSRRIRSTKAKTAWIAYPMINGCVLRPSHALSTANYSASDEAEPNSRETTEHLFPPTFGSRDDGRPSTDSARLAPYSISRSQISPAASVTDISISRESGRPPAIRLRCRDFQMVALHFNHASSDKSADAQARHVFFALRSHCCIDKIEDMLAFHFRAPAQESALVAKYDAHKEFSRMGISAKSADGPGMAWRISDINQDYSFSATYPNVLCVPRIVSDNMLKYGGPFRSRSRIPCLSYLHFNGGSINRSSQPLVGVSGKRNPQDERLVSAIFSSHTPLLVSPEDSPTQLPSLKSPSMTTLGSVTSAEAITNADVPSLPLSLNGVNLDVKSSGDTVPLPPGKIFGSTRRNYIVDARPKLNALANKATGGGIEDVSNYMSAGDLPVEKIFLNIPNIHVMRSSLAKVVDSFANSDYVNIPPDQEMLRKSGWLGHIALLIAGSETVAKIVGLGGSHVLIHCSDGWDRTSQVSALAQMMLEPHYRTLDGFVTLVQKDFLSFGHKFRDRNGVLGSEKWFEIENERISPRSKEVTSSDSPNFNVLGSKALSGARSWFDKNKNSLFRQQNSPHEGNLESPASRPATPPPNPVIHSVPSASGKEEKEHRMNEKEISPIFHQFLEAVYQLQRQHPASFEFNERFLLRLLYQTYAGQYGEFLFNSENERYRHAGRTASVWPHFLARREEFVNPTYVSVRDESLLLPKRGADDQIEVHWWSKLFNRKDEEMNVPQAVVVVAPPSLEVQKRAAADAGPNAAHEVPEGTIDKQAAHEASPNPSLANLRSSFTGLGTRSPRTKDPIDTTASPVRPSITHQETDFEVLSKYAEPVASHDGETKRTEGGSVQMMQGRSEPGTRDGEAEVVPRNVQTTIASNEQNIANDNLSSQRSAEDQSDPLGVSQGAPKDIPLQGRRMEFAAFASQNAYQDR